MPFQNLTEAYEWLDSHINYERSLDRLGYDNRTFEIESFRRRLDRLGNPQRGLRTIHIAGTRGKGSAALTIEALLQAHGYRTATYTSPHINEYRERIRIDGRNLSPEDFTQGMSTIAELSAATGADSPRAFKTVFENLTALFFLAAREHQVDWAIVETGLGGRLDATNVLDPGPVLLTRIGLEHTHLLGDHLTDIAQEKAAILKPGAWGVAGAQHDPSVLEVFRRRSESTRTRLDQAQALCPIHSLTTHPDGLDIELGWEKGPLSITTPLLGGFQAENLQNALAMLHSLAARELIQPLDPHLIRTVLKNMRLPGRMERISRRIDLIVDGAHCPTAARALARAMDEHFGDQGWGLAVAMMRDKDHEAFLEALSSWPGWRWIACYRAPTPRAADPSHLASLARRYFHTVYCGEHIESLLESLPECAEKETRVVATGTLFSIARIQQWSSELGSQNLPVPPQAQPQNEQGPDH